MNDQSGPPDRGVKPGDDTFDKFFGPGHEVDPDRTDPGMPSAYDSETAPAGYHQQPTQGAGYYPVEERPRPERSIAMPLLVIALSVLVLGVVGYLMFRGSGSGASNAGPSAIPTSPAGTPTGGSSSNGSGSSSSSSSTSSSSSSSSSSSVTLPPGQSSCGSPTTFTTSSSVSCAFAARIYSTAQGSLPASGQSSTFQVESLKSEGGSGLKYAVTCTHEPNSFVQCTGVSSPDNGKRPTVYVMPSGQ